MESFGVQVELYPLRREKESVTHAVARRWVEKAHYQPFVSLATCRAQWHYLRSDFIGYVKLVLHLMRSSWGSANFFFGSLAVLPKASYFALDMEKRGVAHIHAHFATHPTAAALIVHRLTGIPFSFTAHGSDLHVERRMLDAKVDEAAFAVTVSNFNREVMVETCGEESRHKIHVLHCGVDSQHFRDGSVERDRQPRLRIACVARLIEVKGHQYLVDACRILQERGTRFACHLVGDGPFHQKIEDQIQSAGLSDSVLLDGPRTRDQVADLLASVDAAVLASCPTSDGRMEGIPVSLMEAMASGLPVVATNISGIPELVEDGVTGFLVPPGDPASLAEALGKLADDRELAERMGAAGRQKILREFDLHGNAKCLAQRFKSIAQTA